MPLLGETITKTITLPVSGAKVTLKNDLTVQKGTAMLEADVKDSNSNVVTAAIVDWDFTQADGTKTPITLDNVQKMFAVDFFTVVQALHLDKLQGLSTEKKSS